VFHRPKKSINGRDTDLPDETEEKLVQHILKFEENMFGLSVIDVRKLAFEVAEINQLKHRFNKNKKWLGRNVSIHS
jgi:hypothetical protein